METNQQFSSRRSGMSLIEVILAIAVAGFVLAAAVSFLVSISTIWVERANRNFFEDHADGVTEFLNSTFASAGIEIALGTQSNTPAENEDATNNENTPANGAEPIPNVSVDSGGNPTDTATTGNNSSSGGSAGLIRSSDEPIAWGRTPGSNQYDDPLISLNLNEAPPLLVGTANSPLASVSVFLHFDTEDGLSLLWHSTLQEEVEDIDDLQRTTISTLVKKMEYIYWDERFEKWETEAEPKKSDQDDSFLLPRFLRLTFEYEGESKMRTVSVPVPSRNVFIF